MTELRQRLREQTPRSSKSAYEIWRLPNTRSEIKHSKQTTCETWLALREPVATSHDLTASGELGITTQRLLIQARFPCALTAPVTKNLFSGLSPSLIC